VPLVASCYVHLGPSRASAAESSDWLILEEVAGTAGRRQEAHRVEARIGHHREAAQEVARSTGQEPAHSIAQEAARNTHTGQQQAGRSGDRQRNRTRRRGQQKAAGP
jgi:hypothetical protein